MCCSLWFHAMSAHLQGRDTLPVMNRMGRATALWAGEFSRPAEGSSTLFCWTPPLQKWSCAV